MDKWSGLSQKEQQHIKDLLRSSDEANQLVGIAVCHSLFVDNKLFNENVSEKQKILYYRMLFDARPDNSWEKMYLRGLNWSRAGLKVLPDKSLSDYLNYYQKYKVCVRHNFLETISPVFLDSCWSFAWVDFSHNQLEKITIKCVWNYETWRRSGRKVCHLKKLDFGYNKLKTFQIVHEVLKDSYYSEKPNVPEFINLKSLFLHNNYLTDLPLEFFDPFFMGNLQRLNLAHNQIEELPEAFSKLPKLKWLNLNDNQLKEFIVPSQSPLKKLMLAGNQLTTLPDNITQLSELRELHLHRNQLTVLPENIGNLTNLERLYLYDNQLESLPDSLKNLKKLKHLSIDSNKFKKLPYIIFDLPNLETITLKHNNDIPKSELDDLINYCMADVKC